MTAAALSIALALVVTTPWRVPPRDPAPSLAPELLGPVRRVRTGGPLWGGLAGVALIAAPVALPVVLAWPTIRAMRVGRRERVDHERAVVRVLPDVVDLLVIGVGAGCSPRAAIERAGPWLQSPIGPALTRAVHRSARGEPFGVALATACGPLGDSLLPLVSLLADAELGGGAVLPGLVRIGDDARRRRRAEARERARRLPVTMLLPLVVCVLPAVVLIGIAPLLLASLSEFQFVP